MDTAHDIFSNKLQSIIMLWGYDNNIDTRHIYEALQYKKTDRYIMYNIEYRPLWYVEEMIYEESYWTTVTRTSIGLHIIPAVKYVW